MFYFCAVIKKENVYGRSYNYWHISIWYIFGAKSSGMYFEDNRNPVYLVGHCLLHGLLSE
jgi:hypothetical protein